MKIFKSIKWRLQIWYGLILVAVLAGLGFTAYQLECNVQLDRINGELDRLFAVATHSLHPGPPGSGRPPPFDGPPPDQMPDDSPPPQESPPDKFHSPQREAEIRSFDSERPGFYLVTLRDGHSISIFGNSPSAPDVNNINLEFGNLLDSTTAPSGFTANEPPPSTTYNTNGWRLMSRRLPSGEAILVGTYIAPDLHELKITALKLTSVGIIILFFGLAGGWWISSRAIRPIEDISATAVKISAGDLSQRINLAETESELGRLATVLNSTFARLDAAFAQQKQFASDAAHELRTPVSVILTQTQTALSRERQAKDYQQTIEACQRAAQRMRKLIGALLELARLDAGQEQMKRLRFDFSKTITDCVELVRPLADERGVKIITELSQLEITGDSERLGLVVANLLTNAIQYNHDGGEIKIKTTVENGMAVLTVSDTGQGIPAEDLPRVFERFYRADKSRSSGNAGLGLAISKAIVAAHGGNIDVLSEENTGTTFTVRLPV